MVEQEVQDSKLKVTKDMWPNSITGIMYLFTIIIDLSISYSLLRSSMDKAAEDAKKRKAIHDLKARLSDQIQYLSTENSAFLNDVAQEINKILKIGTTDKTNVVSLFNHIISGFSISQQELDNLSTYINEQNVALLSNFLVHSMMHRMGHTDHTQINNNSAIAT